MNFILQFRYRLEGVPVYYLRLNNYAVQSIPCRSNVDEFKCLESNQSVNVTNLGSENKLQWVFAYVVRSDIREAIEKRGVDIIQSFKIQINVQCNKYIIK